MNGTLVSDEEEREKSKIEQKEGQKRGGVTGYHSNRKRTD